MNDKAALVTGASSGLGEAIARRLAGEGWVVALLARRRDRLEKLAAEIGKAGNVHVLAGDVRDSAFLETAVTELVDETGRLDLLVNNAGGVTASSGPASDAEIDKVFELNVRAAYRLSLLVLPHLARSSGAIVNIGSAAVARSLPFDLPYLGSKAAIEAMTRGMAKSWGDKGVRVNTVSPGVVATEALLATGITPDEASERYRDLAQRSQAIDVEGQADDIAAAVTYLASDKARFITGATLHVDGGMALGG